MSEDRDYWEAAFWVGMSLVNLSYSVTLRWILAQTTRRNAGNHYNTVFRTPYSMRWFASFMDATGFLNFIGVIIRVKQTVYDQSISHPAVRDPWISLSLAVLLFIATGICFGNAALLRPQEEGEYVTSTGSGGHPIMVSDAGLPLTYRRSLSNILDSSDELATTAVVTPRLGGEGGISQRSRQTV
ncbi:hypothetical protein BDQ17DRAFT_734855 [Cyathus striatus]|nr:hypothetical protein BDQ17DRAFT_734855 [Cyathus striatus]